MQFYFVASLVVEIRMEFNMHESIWIDWTEILKSD